MWTSSGNLRKSREKNVCLNNRRTVYRGCRACHVWMVLSHWSHHARPKAQKRLVRSTTHARYCTRSSNGASWNVETSAHMTYTWYLRDHNVSAKSTSLNICTVLSIHVSLLYIFVFSHTWACVLSLTHSAKAFTVHREILFLTNSGLGRDSVWRPFLYYIQARNEMFREGFSLSRRRLTCTREECWPLYSTSIQYMPLL